MLVKRDINHHRSVKVKVGAVSTCPIPSVQISFIISQPCNQLNCIGQQCNLMGTYRCTVQPCVMKPCCYLNLYIIGSFCVSVCNVFVYLWFQVGFPQFPVGFHGFSWFQVGFSCFQVGFSWFFIVPGWFFMVLGRFSWFFMVQGGFSWFQVGFSWFQVRFHCFS